jgi:glycosyltransferase involved in cell wall biosynthesis
MSNRILIDGRFIGVGDSIARYVLEMLDGILKIDDKNEYTLLIRPVGRPKLSAYPELLKAKNLKVVELDIPHYSISEQTKLIKYLNTEKFDLVHFTQFNHPVAYRGKFVTTIHDLTLVGHLHYFNLLKQLAYNTVMKDAAKRSAKVIAISQYTKDDIIEFFHIKDDQIRVIYHGIDHARFNNKIENRVERVAKFKKDNEIAGDYLLYTGMWKKHKNLKRLFEAYEQYLLKSGSKLQLVMVGAIDEKEPEILAEIDRINAKFDKKMILTVGPRYGDELVTAYAGALFYVIPSLSEGFGWPPLEAMACGVPVIASKESCIPEILGDAPIYFNPYEIKEIKEVIEKVAVDASLRAELAKKGLGQVKKYDWEKTAKETLEVYEEALK